MSTTEAPGPRPRPDAGMQKRRPDARPTRLILGIGTVAALSIATAGLARFPVTSAADATTVVALESSDLSADASVQCVRFVRLERGARAPEGASIISGAELDALLVGDSARSQVTTIPRSRVVARSRQSGG